MRLTIHGSARRTLISAIAVALFLSIGVARAEVILAPPFDSAPTASGCTSFEAGVCTHQAAADAASGEVELRASQTSPGGGSVPGPGGASARAFFHVTHVLAEAQSEVVYSATLSVREAKAVVSGSSGGSRLANVTVRLSAFHLSCTACSGFGDITNLATHTGPTEINNEQVVVTVALQPSENGQIPAGDVLVRVELEAFASSGGADTGTSLAKLEGTVTSLAVS